MRAGGAEPSRHRSRQLLSLVPVARLQVESSDGITGSEDVEQARSSRENLEALLLLAPGRTNGRPRHSVSIVEKFRWDSVR